MMVCPLLGKTEIFFFVEVAPPSGKAHAIIEAEVHLYRKEVLICTILALYPLNVL